MGIESLRAEYLDLVNVQLPAIARVRKFPIRVGHCFGRVLLDHLFSDCWYGHLDQFGKVPAYRQLSEDQLVRAIAMAQAFIDKPNSYIQRINKESKTWRQNAKALSRLSV